MSVSVISRAVATGLVLGTILVLITVMAITMEDSPFLVSARGYGVLTTRDAVVEAMVEALPGDLPGGAIAVLQPDLPSPGLVDHRVVSTWTALLTARIRNLRPGLELTSREHLEAILREQRFANSGYVSPDSPVRVGRLVAARMLLLSEVREFRFAGAGVKVALSVQLLDVETGSIIWSYTRAGGIFPPWPRPVRFLLVVLALTAGALAFLRGVRTRAAHRAWMRWARVRHNVDALTRAATATRTRYIREDLSEIAHRQERAWRELDTALDLIRHVPQPARAARALGPLSALTSTILRLKSACEDSPTSRRAGLALVHELSRGASAVRGLAGQLSPVTG